MLWALLALGVALLGGIGAARASVVEALSLAELVERAEHVVVATAGERMGRRSGNLIVTDVALRVDEGLKGGSKRGDTLVATLLGGELDGLGLTVPGEAALPEGHRLVVFLRQARDGQELRVVGMAQGALPIERRAGVPTVLPPSHDAELMRRASDGHLKKGEAAVPDAIALPDLLTRIRSLVASLARDAR